MELNYGETWIEERIARKIDRLDALYMAGKISEQEYNVLMQSIEDWGDDCFAREAIKSGNSD